jgi:hypothetical protein
MLRYSLQKFYLWCHFAPFISFLRGFMWYVFLTSSHFPWQLLLTSSPPPPQCINVQFPYGLYVDGSRYECSHRTFCSTVSTPFLHLLWPSSEKCSSAVQYNCSGIMAAWMAQSVSWLCHGLEKPEGEVKADGYWISIRRSIHLFSNWNSIL